MMVGAEIEQASLQSLKVTAIRENGVAREKFHGTAFIVQRNSRDYLVTNRHVLTKRDPDNPAVPLEGSTALPLHLRVEFNGEQPNRWSSHRIELYDADKRACWFSHPSGPHVDVAAIPLGEVPGTSRYAHDLEPGMPVRVGVTGELYIVGFPFDVPVDGHLPIWSRGTIATEPNVPYLGDNAFLIDSRTRPGQSGSPVISFTPAGNLRSLEGRGMIVLNQPSVELLGIYSGRMTSSSDLGRVWHRDVIKEVIDAKARDPEVAN